MSKSAASAEDGSPRKIYSAYDDPGTAEEISRRTFMANATLTVGGIIGLGLVIPIVGSLLPAGEATSGNWSPLTADELRQLEAATAKPVKLTFSLKAKDSYLPTQTTSEYVWGIKTDPSKFKDARKDLFDAGKGASVPYESVNMDFVIFSPICPHLGCRFIWDDSNTRFACPCHGSQFGKEGEHLAGPAPRGLDPLPFREQSGIAQIQWIRYKSSVEDRIVISYQS